MASRPRLVERTGFGAVPAANASSDPSPPGSQGGQALVASPLSMVPQGAPNDVRDRPLRVVSSDGINLIRRVVGVSAVEDQCGSGTTSALSNQPPRSCMPNTWRVPSGRTVFGSFV
jgi:hypothetical protein